MTVSSTTSTTGTTGTTSTTTGNNLAITSGTDLQSTFLQIGRAHV